MGNTWNLRYIRLIALLCRGDVNLSSGRERAREIKGARYPLLKEVTSEGDGSGAVDLRKVCRHSILGLYKGNCDRIGRDGLESYFYIGHGAFIWRLIWHINTVVVGQQSREDLRCDFVEESLSDAEYNPRINREKSTQKRDKQYRYEGHK